jgi:hypothetical protein
LRERELRYGLQVWGVLSTLEKGLAAANLQENASLVQEQ